ncbi:MULTISPECIES: aspartate/glutamate racemase family protein [unclassified Janthinobacterium]|uniref:aspartate/glutamate racemase family protein n=1 Tax=unclassified Janthinobacterium TaxID=2610881 RepID=UPI0012F9FB10|nr:MULTISPECIES: aspartate/glutamate racemase family protein [unclassified Janthinobacterium]MEC5160489.1 aspartate/glutamate racemase [Janthinobacterium sp. CG_S6]
MQTIGLIGGIGWASTAEYYRLINERIGARLGVAHSARIILFSIDQFDFTARAAQADPASIHDFLVEEGVRLKAAGADFFLFCANGVHRFADNAFAGLFAVPLQPPGDAGQAAEVGRRAAGDAGMARL